MGSRENDCPSADFLFNFFGFGFVSFFFFRCPGTSTGSAGVAMVRGRIRRINGRDPVNMTNMFKEVVWVMRWFSSASLYRETEHDEVLSSGVSVMLA